MSEDPTEDTTEMDSYQVAVTKQFEIDFSKEQMAALMKQTGAKTPEDALESTILNRERDLTEPEEKLTGVNVQANGPSDD